MATKSKNDSAPGGWRSSASTHLIVPDNPGVVGGMMSSDLHPRRMSNRSMMSEMTVVYKCFRDCIVRILEYKE